MRRQFRLTVVVLSLGLLVAAGAAGYATSAAHVYVVQPGDSLWAISQANGLTVAQLAAANDMSANDLLLIGRHLNIPAAGSTSDDESASAASSSAGGGSAGSPAGNPWTFCSTFSEAGGPW